MQAVVHSQDRAQFVSAGSMTAAGSSSKSAVGKTGPRLAKATQAPAAAPQIATK
jgi:hypothetical protein